jgi:hypothetical protein
MSVNKTIIVYHTFYKFHQVNTLYVFSSIITTDYDAVYSRLFTWWCNKALAGRSGRKIWGLGLDRWDAETTGLNPAEGMDGCLSSSIHHHHSLVTLSLMLSSLITEKAS